MPGRRWEGLGFDTWLCARSWVALRKIERVHPFVARLLPGDHCSMKVV